MMAEKEATSYFPPVHYETVKLDLAMMAGKEAAIVVTCTPSRQ